LQKLMDDDVEIFAGSAHERREARITQRNAIWRRGSAAIF
jgi:hypothetical protein